MREEGIWRRVVGDLSGETACEKALWKLEGSGSLGESSWPDLTEVVVTVGAGNGVRMLWSNCTRALAHQRLPGEKEVAQCGPFHRINPDCWRRLDGQFWKELSITTSNQLVRASY